MAHNNTRSPCDKVNPDPPKLDNRAGKSQIDYRIGTQPEFLERMKWQIPRITVRDRLSDEDIKPLRTLRARETDDPSIALMDAFAAALDVTSFYSERIINEAFVGTATQRRSILELARLIGYELNPGVAASTHLALTVEAADDPFRVVEVSAGMQAMSIPQEKGQLPQIFETTEMITARAEWNTIPIRQLRQQNLAIFNGKGKDPRNGSIYLFDLDNSFADDPDVKSELKIIDKENDLNDYFPVNSDLDLKAKLADLKADHAYNPEIEPVLKAVPVDEVFLSGTGLVLQPGQRLLLVGQNQDGADKVQTRTAIFRILTVEEDRNYRITRLTVSEHGRHPVKTRRAPRFRSARLPIRVLPTRQMSLRTETADRLILNGIWSGSGMNALVGGQGWKRTSVMTLVGQALKRHISRRSESKTVSGKAGEPGIYVMRSDGGFFGQGATRQEMLAKPEETRGADPYSESWDGKNLRTVWVDSQGALLSGAAQVYLDREYKEMLPESWAVFENPAGGNMAFQVTGVTQESRSDFATTGKTTGLNLSYADGNEVNPIAEKDFSSLNSFKFRTAHFYAQSQRLEVTGIPVFENISNDTNHLDLDGLFLDLESGRAISLSGDRTDAEGLMDSETLIVQDVMHIGGYTRLQLKYSPENDYERTSVRINANVAAATHGEYFEEVLGSGNATEASQVFYLGKKPLTFVSAANALGRQSSLEIRVDSILWHEIPSLWDAGPDDAVYQVRISDGGSVSVQFGDGRNGRRITSGESNVTAAYRTGSGHAGEVADEAIALLKTKPLGIKSVVNTSAASGSAEPESMDNARINAPQSVRSFGRIISLTDYEDFARNFSGIGKAKAISIWTGSGQTVHLTVSPENDAILDSAAPVLSSLQAAIEGLRDPRRPFVVQAYRRAYFQLQGKITVDADFDVIMVENEVRSQLLNDFGYITRSIGQAVSAAEVLSSIHRVAGVRNVDLDILDSIEDGEVSDAKKAELDSVIPAKSATLVTIDGQIEFLPSELLTLLSSSIHLTMENAHA